MVYYSALNNVKKLTWVFNEREIRKTTVGTLLRSVRFVVLMMKVQPDCRERRHPGMGAPAVKKECDI